MRRISAVLLALAALPLPAAKVLFDASHREMAGNADWVADADLHDLPLPAFGTCPATTLESNPQRFPAPAQSGITAATPETYWTGAASGFAVALAKAGHTIESLPPGGQITFGDGSNLQDLSQYQLFIIPEPQIPFTAAERTAILAYVNAGGGLFMIGDHETSDRDCDGFDSPAVFNGLTGATSTYGGVFGIWFRVDGSSTKPSEDWFDEGVNNNVSPDPADPIIHGPFGDGSGGLGLFGSTSMELFPADNPTAAGHVWRNSQTARDTHRVTFATASYGAGRVAAIGDSSPLDDGTGDPGDTLYGGWDKATGGVNNDRIHLNAANWLLNPVPDTTPPVITAGPAALAGDCSTRVTWTTDENANSVVHYGASAAYGQTATAPGYGLLHDVVIAGLTPGALYHYEVCSTDPAGNGPACSADAVFINAAAAPPVILSGPNAAVSGLSATLTWTTDEPSDSRADYGTTTGYGSSASNPAPVTAHSLTLSGLTPDTAYHYRVGSLDGCGNGPVFSGDATFATANSLDLSGWTLEQFNSTQTYVFPAGTQIQSGGYLVLARDATQAQFETFFGGPLPAGATFVNSNPNGSCTAGCFPQVNGGESFRLKDNLGAVRDGTTITFSATGKANQRTAPGAPAGVAGSWNILASTSANPGSGAGAGSGAGVVINEMTDPTDYTKEYLELYYDAGSVDTVAPATINPIAAVPTGSTTARVDFVAVGDDGTTGTATAYDLRRSPYPIRGEADFAAATPVGGLTAPKTAGQAEQLAVGGLNANATYCFALKVRDEANNWSGLSGTACATTALAGSGGGVNHLVISQLRVAGGTDDFAEIYNPTAAPVNLGSAYSIQYLAAAGTFGSKLTLTGTIPAHGWYLVAGTGYTGSPAADQALSGSISFGGTSGHVVLVSGTANTTCASVTNIDKVGYGSASCPEGTAVAAPAAGNSVVRKPNDASGNGTDTDNNVADFTGLTPAAPRNAGTPPASTGPALGNVGASLYLSPDLAATKLVWARAYGATFYRVYRGASPGGLALWTSPSANVAADPETPAPIYFYRVTASDGTNESAD